MIGAIVFSSAEMDFEWEISVYSKYLLGVHRDCSASEVSAAVAYNHRFWWGRTT